MEPRVDLGWSVLSASGGMDSTSLLLHLLARGTRAHLVSFRYGQKHVLELEFLRHNVQYLRGRGFDLDWQIVNLESLQPLLHSALTSPEWDVPVGHYEQQNMRETVVPNRNAIFASIAYAWSLSIANRNRDFGNRSPVAFALGVHSGDHTVYPDCRPEFYEALMKAFELGNWDSDQVKLYLPYLNWDKAAILRDALTSCEQLGLDFDLVFANTLTGYAPNDQGESTKLTGADVERILAFDAIGRADPLPYPEPWPEMVAKAQDVLRRFEKEK